ncbi:MAG: hypothetical protein AAGB12_07440 [Pseudomonadota bacterium]
MKTTTQPSRIALLVSLALSNQLANADIFDDDGINNDARTAGEEYVLEFYDASASQYGFAFNPFFSPVLNNYIVLNFNAFSSSFNLVQEGRDNSILMNDDFNTAPLFTTLNNADFNFLQVGFDNRLVIRGVQNVSPNPLGNAVNDNFINFDIAQFDASNQVLILPITSGNLDNWQRLDLSITQSGSSSLSGNNLVALNAWVDGDNTLSFDQDGEFNAIINPVMGFWFGVPGNTFISTTESNRNTIILEQFGINNRIGNVFDGISAWDNTRFAVGGINENSNGDHFNTVFVRQDGINNIIDLEVYGFNNFVDIRQDTFSYQSRVNLDLTGDFNDVIIDTIGVDNNRNFFELTNLDPVNVSIRSAFGTISRFNQVNIEQSFTINSYVTVDILGSDNDINLFQGLNNFGQASQNAIDVRVGSNFNPADENAITVSQRGSFNTADIRVGTNFNPTDENDITLNQQGFDNSALITIGEIRSSDNNDIVIEQTGFSNSVALSVNGDFHNVDIEQDGNFNDIVGEDLNDSFEIDGIGQPGFNELSITQTGNFNLVMGGMESNFNTLVINQVNGQFARTFTAGFGNTVTITQITP